MSKNLFNRIITTIILLALLFIINFSHDIIFILSILILGGVVCVEANNMFSKIVGSNYLNHSKYTFLSTKFNYKLFILNSTFFIYIFFALIQRFYKLL